MVVEAEVMLGRIRTAVESFDRDAYLATPLHWDDPTRTDKALRSLTIDFGLSVMQRGLRVKKRYRMEVFEAVVTAATSGYAMGRFLLGTNDAHPSYSTPADEAAISAQIGQRSENYESDAVMSALSGPILDIWTCLPEGHVLTRRLGVRIASATCLTSAVSGVCIAMAEEELFGPLR